MVEPIPLRPFLTMEAMEVDDDAEASEAALSSPLPHNPSLELLIKAQRKVFDHLEFVTHHVVALGLDADTIRAEVNRSAARLIEIALQWEPAARRLIVPQPKPAAGPQ
jgi:hypothetical protein